MLSFTEEQIFWQCSEAAACEEYPHDPIERLYYQNQPFWSTVPQEYLLLSNRCGEVRGYKNIAQSTPERWFNTIERYCELELTFPDKDKIKAVEGIGIQTAVILGDTYRHGMTSSTLLPSLLWCIPHDAHDAQSCHRSPTWRAPTWHWASWDGPLGFWEPRNIYEQIGWSRMMPLVKLFMSDNFDPLATDGSIDTWPLLMCIGRLLRLKLDDPKKLNDTESDYKFELEDGGTIQFNVCYLDERGIIWDSSEHLAVLPIVGFREVRAWEAEVGIMASTDIDYKGLLVRKSDHGTFYRSGVVVWWNATTMAKPSLVVLE
jgi:hypothetical protein